MGFAEIKKGLIEDINPFFFIKPRDHLRSKHLQGHWSKDIYEVNTNKTLSYPGLLDNHHTEILMQAYAWLLPAQEY